MWPIGKGKGGGPSQPEEFQFGNTVPALTTSLKQIAFDCFSSPTQLVCFVPCRDGEQIEQADDEEKYSFNYDGSELIIKKVDKSDEAEYICIAENKAGEQDATIHLKVFGKYALTILPFQSSWLWVAHTASWK